MTNKSKKSYLDSNFISKYKHYSVNMLSYLDMDEYGLYKNLHTLDVDRLKNKIKSLDAFLNTLNKNNSLEYLVYDFLSNRYNVMEFIYFLSLGYQKKDISYHHIAYAKQLNLFQEPDFNDYQNALADFEKAIDFVLDKSFLNDDIKFQISKYKKLFLNNGISSFDFFHNKSSISLDKNDIKVFIKNYFNMWENLSIDIKASHRLNFSTQKDVLFYPVKDMYIKELVSSLAHETVHQMVFYNAQKSTDIQGNMLYLLQKNNTDNILYQEGLAVLSEMNAIKDFDNFKFLEYGLRVIYTYELLHMPNNKKLFNRFKGMYDVFTMIYYPKYNKYKLNDGFKYLFNRIKRGFDNNTQYVFLKDWNYWKGYYYMINNMKNKNDFLLGKISKNNLELLKKLNFLQKNECDFLALIEDIYTKLHFLIKNI